MTDYWLELRATIEALTIARAEAHTECDILRYYIENNRVYYDPTVHHIDCIAISKELMRLADILEFVEAPHSYNPGNLMRKIERGRYNLRTRKVDRYKGGKCKLRCSCSLIPRP
jgi:hypothetical protein